MLKVFVFIFLILSLFYLFSIYLECFEAKRNISAHKLFYKVMKNIFLNSNNFKIIFFSLNRDKIKVLLGEIIEKYASVFETLTDTSVLDIPINKMCLNELEEISESFNLFEENKYKKKIEYSKEDNIKLSKLEKYILLIGIK